MKGAGAEDNAAATLNGQAQAAIVSQEMNLPGRVQSMCFGGVRLMGKKAGTWLDGRK